MVGVTARKLLMTYNTPESLFSYSLSQISKSPILSYEVADIGFREVKKHRIYLTTNSATISKVLEFHIPCNKMRRQ
jgi:hypothetical protein